MTLRDAIETIEAGLNVTFKALDKACIESFELHDRDVWHFD